MKNIKLKVKIMRMERWSDGVVGLGNDRGQMAGHAEAWAPNGGGGL
jgi:hypothetical protein